MEEIIKQLEEKKEILHRELDLKINKIDKVIDDLKDIDYGDAEKTEQKIKPIEIDLKPLTKKEIKLLKKFEKEKKVSTTQRREIVTTKKPSKKKVIYSDDPRLKSKKDFPKKKGGGGRPRGRRMFSEEIDEFIRRNWESNKDSELRLLINTNFGIEYSVEQIKGNRRNLGCASAKIGRKKGQKDIRREKKIGKPKKYTDEVMQFLKENINNFKNKGLCEELESRFNLKTDPVKLQNILSQKKIKRDPKPGVDQEIIEFINKSKTKDAYALRDKIIEKFEKNISLTDIREIINKRPKLSGESVQDEVKRIEGQREDTEHEDSIDDLDLDR